MSPYDFGFYMDILTTSRREARERAKQREAEGFQVLVTHRWLFTHVVWLHETSRTHRADGLTPIHVEDDQKCVYCGAPSTQLVRWAGTWWDVLTCDEHGPQSESA